MGLIFNVTRKKRKKIVGIGGSILLLMIVISLILFPESNFLTIVICPLVVATLVTIIFEVLTD